MPKLFPHLPSRHIRNRRCGFDWLRSGHRVGKLDGVMGVFVPGPPIKRIKRSKAKIVDNTKVEDDGTMCLSPTQQTDRLGRD